MHIMSNTYDGYTSSEGAVLAAFSVILVIGIIAFLLVGLVIRAIRKQNNPQLNSYLARSMSKQVKFYGRTFMSGYNEERRKNNVRTHRSNRDR